jgi:hypothetical protein
LHYNKARSYLSLPNEPYDFPLPSATSTAPAPGLAFHRILAGLTGGECNIDLRKQADRLARVTFELVQNITLIATIARFQGDVQELKVAAPAYATQPTPQRFNRKPFHSRGSSAHRIPGVDKIRTDADNLDVWQGSRGEVA